MKPRPPQTNGQQEPGYPEHETVVYSIRYGNLTAHRPRPRCMIEAPHMITECGEWRHAIATMVDDPMAGTRMLGCMLLALLALLVVIVVLAAVYG